MVLEVGQFEFTKVRELGAGGLGRVDVVQIVRSNSDLAVGTQWARKRLNEKWMNHPEHRIRFEREIQAAKTMTHPAIVPYKGENLPGGERFYMMPLYPETLRHRLARRKNGFPWKMVADFGAAVADALQYAHDCGFTHRDLKPENILLTTPGTPIIADWGLGYFVHRQSKVLQQLTRGGMGTEYYCSLEQWNTGKCGPAGDIYSLGVVLAELVRGSQLPMTVGMGIQVDVVTNDGSFDATLFNALIREMTALMPTDRPPSMAAVAWRLRTSMDASTFMTSPVVPNWM